MIVSLHEKNNVSDKISALRKMLSSAAVPFRVILHGGAIIRASATKITADRIIAMEGRGSSCLIALSDIFDIHF